MKELAQHLDWVVCKEKKQKLGIPTKPKPKVPQPKKKDILGTPTKQVAVLDNKNMED